MRTGTLQILVFLGCVLATLSLKTLPGEERYQETLGQLSTLSDNGELDKLRTLLGSEEFERLMSIVEGPILGGEGDPDNYRPILGGEDDPDNYRPILGGEDDPDNYRPILGGKDDPDNYRPILGGGDDPDNYRPILGGEGDPDNYKPILGGEDDPDNYKPILGGEGDPDNYRPILGGEGNPDTESIFGGQSDPDQDFRARTDELETEELVDFPEELEQSAPKIGNFKPIRGRSPAQQRNNKVSHPQTDIPADVDPCMLSDLPEPRSLDELCEGVECPVFQVVEIEGVCGFQLRKYNAGVWVMTEMDTKKRIPEALAEASEKLMEYMNRGNDGNVKMDITLPQTVVYIINNKETEKQAYLSQYLPVSQHESPPKPLEGKSLIIKRVPEVYYYVRAFGGKPSIDTYRREFGMLAAAINKAGLNAVWNMHFFQEYSNKGDESQRHEVAVMVASSQS